MKVGWSSLLLLPLAAAVWAAPPRYVSSPEIIINARPANDTTVEHVQLWVSTDDGQSWHQPDTVPADGSATRYTADRDGRYDFYLVLENSAGTSGPAPQAGTKSAITVVVDTIPPLLQVHDAVSPDNNESVVINVTLIEENLGEDGLRVFYRTPSEIWQDGGPAFHNGELATWDAPADLSDDAEIRLVATDLAGNRSATEPLSLADVVVTTQPTTVPAVCDPEPITPPTVEIDPVQVADVEMDTVLPPEIEPFSPTLPDTPAESATADRTAEVNPDGLDTSEVEHLRELASQFMQRGDYRLALARLQDAIEVEPGNADLLVDLGSALYRQNHYDEARERFQKAADIMPSHVGALDGLALVAATQKTVPSGPRAPATVAGIAARFGRSLAAHRRHRAQAGSHRRRPAGLAAGSPGGQRRHRPHGPR